MEKPEGYDELMEKVVEQVIKVEYIKPGVSWALRRQCVSHFAQGNERDLSTTSSENHMTYTIWDEASEVPREMWDRPIPLVVTPTLYRMLEKSDADMRLYKMNELLPAQRRSAEHE